MNSTDPLILIIEDELPTRRFLRAVLTSQGYRLAEAVAGREGLAQAATLRPDLIILELELPDINGLHVIAQLREWASTPIVVLSARCQEGAKVAALDGGADDYLTKPCGVGELLARMRVALRRAAGAGQKVSEPIFTIGELRLDLTMRHVSRSGVAVHLTPTEYRLLITLAQHAGKVLTHRQLLKQVWGPAYTDAAHYLRVYMGQLRRKLESDPTRPRYLLTEPGVGYRFAAEQLSVPLERSFQTSPKVGFGSDFAASEPPPLSSQQSTAAKVGHLSR
jgi:two-component system, OmpR family, KDP operon response regulator KdpE